MSKSEKRITVLIFSILFVMAIILAFYIYGISMVWGAKKKTVTFMRKNVVLNKPEDKPIHVYGVIRFY